MDEVKLRIIAINKALSHIKNGTSQAEAIFQAEYCFLQIRMICEIVALSSLAAHSTVGLSNGILKYWNAERIFSDLLKINPHCFPRAISAERLDNGTVSYEDGHKFDLQDLKTIYAGCAEMLHRSMGKQIVARAPKGVDVSKIRKWAGELVRLLSNHMIYVSNIDTLFVVSLSVPPDGGVQVALAAPHKI